MVYCGIIQMLQRVQQYSHIMQSQIYIYNQLNRDLHNALYNTHVCIYLHSNAQLIYFQWIDQFHNRLNI